MHGVMNTRLKQKMMRLFILGTFVACAIATELEKKPSFTWLHDRLSDSGVPLLQINFPDYGEIDYAELEPYNPIPQRPHEREEDVDNCIFQGKLKNEPKVHVTVTGGCPRDEIFEIQFRSKRLSDHLFKFKKSGEVEILKSPLSDRSLEFMVQDMALGDLEPEVKRGGSDRIVLPPTLVMNVGAYFEQTFKARFGPESLNTMRRVLAQTQNIYYWPTLTTRIRMNVVLERELNMVLQADGGNLSYALTVGTDPNINTNVIMCSQNDQYGVVGIGWLGTVCATSLGYRSNINEYFFTDSQTAQIVAHEIGHNLNMAHDFTATGAARFDSQNRPCTNIGGIMDYNQPVYSVWSTCSVEDFTTYYNQYTSFCMPQDINPGSSTSPSPSTPPTPSPPTSPTLSPPLPGDGNWGEWVEYIPCSVTCGSGQLVRWRQCNNPPPMPGGQPCAGCNAEYYPCALQPCTTPNLTVTFEVQDVVSRTYLRPATIHFNGMDTMAPLVVNDVINATTYNVGASSPGYMDALVRPVSVMAVGSAATSVQHVTLLAPQVLPNQLIVVLGWSQAIVDLDLHIVQFKIGNSSDFCHLYYGNRACPDSVYPGDWLFSGAFGGESAILNNTSNYGYGVFVKTFNTAQGRPSVDVYGLTQPIVAITSYPGPEYFWTVGCINGATGNAVYVNTFNFSDPTMTLAATCASQF